MKSSTIEGMVWPLVFGGMGMSMLGLWIVDADAGLGYGLLVGGGVAVLIGLLLIWLRSRLPNDERTAGPP